MKRGNRNHLAGISLLLGFLLVGCGEQPRGVSGSGAAVSGGLVAQSVEQNYGLLLRSYASNNWSGSFTVRAVSSPQISWNAKESWNDGAEQSLVWESALLVPRTGNYTFAAAGEGASFRVTIDDKEIKDFGSSLKISLVGGKTYKIRIELVKTKKNGFF